MANPISRLEGVPAAELAGASGLLQQRVIDGRGEALGFIEDLMLDVEGGTVAYAVLAVETGDGGRKRFALPWHVLRVLPDGGGVAADLSREALARSPGMPAAPRADAAPASPGPAAPERFRLQW